ncbi:hypothetical protein O6H91_Y164100 [Diphasiastrum complanatum]|nr:hypothetical protein O6H91_Y164100 [Diphasiastrum complanatum]
MGKSARWLKKIFGVKKSSKSPLKEKSGMKGNDEDQVIASKSSNGVQSVAKAPTQQKVRKELVEAVEVVPHLITSRAEDQRFMQVKQEPRKTTVAATVEPVTSHPLPPIPDIQPSLHKSPYHETENVERKAAIKIQTAFRGYLAYRAFRALKGLVRLQALVRGHQVRKQAAASLRCVLAIVKVQAHIRAYHVRMSKKGQEAQKILYKPQSACSRKILEGSCPLDSFELEKKHSKEGNGVLAYALQRQSFSSLQLGESKSGWHWLEHWTAARPWALQSVRQEKPFSPPKVRCSEINGDAVIAFSVRRFKHDSKISSGSKPKTFLTEQTTSPKQSTRSFTTPGGPSRSIMSDHSYLPPELSPAGSPWAESSPAREVTPLPPSYQNSPFSDSRSSNGSMSIHDSLASQTVSRNSVPVEKESQFASSKSTPRFSNGSKSSSVRHESPILAKAEHTESQTQESPTMVPSYMATTESSKAKARSNSTPRNRPNLSEKSPQIYKRRLSLPGSNGKASPETSRSQRWNSNVKPSNMGFTPSLRLDRPVSSVRDSSGVPKFSFAADLRRSLK